jgi:hypothetical protein
MDSLSARLPPHSLGEARCGGPDEAQRDFGLLWAVVQASPLLGRYAVIADEAANRPDSSTGAAVLLALAGKGVYLSAISTT